MISAVDRKGAAMTQRSVNRSLGYAIFLVSALALTSRPAFAQCGDVPDHAALTNALDGAVDVGGTANGGLGNNMWATVVNRDGIVCAVTFTGGDRDDQWPGSRVISAQKANTANAFSLALFPLSTANIYSAVQPGGSLFGLQESNPVNVAVAYAGDAQFYGTAKDPMFLGKIGGVNVFGGGLALYNAAGALVGAIGVSGDTSCTDHIVAWKTRHALNFDNVPNGVAGGTDNIIFDIRGSNGNFASKSGFGHPECGFGEAPIATALPKTHPTGGAQ
jgi:uncharacterized protein GlcG (DUF336 family)